MKNMECIVIKFAYVKEFGMKRKKVINMSIIVIMKQLVLVIILKIHINFLFIQLSNVLRNVLEIYFILIINAILLVQKLIQF